jgi:excisionase family DNA binding protein
VKQVNVADLPLTMQKLADLPPVITVKETARLLRLSRSAAYRAAKAGQLQTFRMGRKLLVPTAPLLRMLGR